MKISPMAHWNKSSIMALLRNGGASALACFAIIASLLAYFYNQFWYPQDEGVYAYVAQRIIAGDKLHRDLLDLHGGYGNYLNAAAMLLFGQDMLSLRYPLIAMNLLQCAIVWILLRPAKGQLMAATGIIGVGVFSFLPFLNPSANWHALLFAFLMALLLDRRNPEQKITIIIAGTLIGLCFMTRQLNGVVLAMGSLSWLLLRLTAPAPAPRWPVLTLTAIMAAGVSGYMLYKQSFGGFILFGLGPLIMLFFIARQGRMQPLDCARLLGLLGAGFCLGIMPLLITNLINGSIAEWIRDLYHIPVVMNQMPYMDARWHEYLLYSMLSVLMSGSIYASINSVVWCYAIVFCVGVSIFATVAAIKGKLAASSLPLIAIFWTISAAHYESYVYLFFVFPILMGAKLYLYPSLPSIAGIIMLSVWLPVFHVGQPFSKGMKGVFSGERSELDATAMLPRVSLRLEQQDYQDYSAVLERIRQVARPDEPLMTIPMSPELNFITGRRSPHHYYSTFMGVRSAEDVQQSLERLKEAAPLFIVHRPEDPHLLPPGEALLAAISELCPPPERIGAFELYRLPASAEP